MTASAQTTFLDKLRKNETGKGKVVVMQSPEIDALVNGKPAAAAPSATSSTTARQHPAQTTPSQNANGATTHSTPNPTTSTPSTHSSTSTSDTEEETVAVDTRKKVMRNSYKTTGYRIQVFSGGNKGADKLKAEAAGRAMKAHFPNEPIYVHFYSPSWKCRMGNYRELADAQRILSQVKACGYPNACIVKGTISVQY